MELQYSFTQERELIQALRTGKEGEASELLVSKARICMSSFPRFGNPREFLPGFKKEC